jgi:hypothetical protein
MSSWLLGLFCRHFLRFSRREYVVFMRRTCGHSNSRQNSRLLSAENPQALVETHVRSLEIGMWCMVSRMRTVRQLLFVTTINEECMRIFWHSLFLWWRNIKGDFWFSMIGWLSTLRTKQPLYCYRVSISWWQHFWSWRWPSRSPDHTPPYFFLWDL